MQTTLRINTRIFRQAKAAAAQEGVTLTKFIEEALEGRLRRGATMERPNGSLEREIAKRNRMMDALLRRTAHFRIGPRPSREEMNARGNK
jgi:hypothetical protein